MSHTTPQPDDCCYSLPTLHLPPAVPTSGTFAAQLQVHGANSLTDTELLALLLDDAPDEEARLQQAQQLLQDHHGLVGLSRVAIDELGTSADGAARIKAALELARRLFSAAPRERPVINCASKLAHHLLLDMRPLEQEVLKCALLTTQLHLIKIVTIHQGTLNSNIVRAGDVFREPVRLGAAAVLLAHNHPSGDMSPSAEDIETTRQLVAAGNLLDISVLDHLIIGDSWISMRAQAWGWPTSPPEQASPTLLNERRITAT